MADWSLSGLCNVNSVQSWVQSDQRGFWDCCCWHHMFRLSVPRSKNTTIVAISTASVAELLQGHSAVRLECQIGVQCTLHDES